MTFSNNDQVSTIAHYLFDIDISMLKRLCMNRIYLSKLHRFLTTKQKAELQLEYTTVKNNKMFYDSVLRCFLLELYLCILTSEKNTETPKLGLKLNTFARTLSSVHV